MLQRRCSRACASVRTQCTNVSTQCTNVSTLRTNVSTWTVDSSIDAPSHSSCTLNLVDLTSDFRSPDCQSSQVRLQTPRQSPDYRHTHAKDRSHTHSPAHAEAREQAHLMERKVLSLVLLVLSLVPDARICQICWTPMY